MRTLIGPCPECGQRSYIPREHDGRWRCPRCERLYETRRRDEQETPSGAVRSHERRMFQGHGPESRAALVPASRSQTTEPHQFALPEPPARFTDRASLFADIEQLLNEATTPITDRRRNFFEWLGGIDPRAEQVARKMAAAKTADELTVQRTVLFKHLEQMVQAMADAEVARLEAHVRVQRAQLAALELEDQIRRAGGAPRCAPTSPAGRRGQTAP